MKWSQEIYNKKEWALHDKTLSPLCNYLWHSCCKIPSDCSWAAVCPYTLFRVSCRPHSEGCAAVTGTLAGGPSLHRVEAMIHKIWWMKAWGPIQWKRRDPLNQKDGCRAASATSDLVAIYLWRTSGQSLSCSNVPLPSSWVTMPSAKLPVSNCSASGSGRLQWSEDTRVEAGDRKPHYSHMIKLHSGYRQPAIDQYICETILNRSWIKKK